MRQRWFGMAAMGALAVLGTPAYAQRAAENAVNSAEDAFGVSVGNETIGLYTQSSARGFNPQQAGNIRVDGLYFDLQGTAEGRTYADTTMRVGLSAQSYPFPAPTGIVDIRLRQPLDHVAGSGTILVGPFHGVQLDAEVTAPIAPEKLSGYWSVSGGSGELDPHISYNNLIYGGVLRWTPSDTVAITAFLQGKISQGEIPPLIFTPGGVIPPEYDRSTYFNQTWTRRERDLSHSGVMLSARIFGDWLLRAGVFRSSQLLTNDYVSFYRNVQPDGSGTIDVLAVPASRDFSYSGETRLTRSFIEGSRQHTFHIAVRGRSTEHVFGGGSPTISLGTGHIGVVEPKPKPNFVIGPTSLDQVTQLTPGLSYVGRWIDIGEFSVGAQKSFYRRKVAQPLGIARTKAEPWLYNTTLAVYLGKNTALYGSYTRGLEESGIAPDSAANRGEAMHASLTRQIDAGIRYKFSPGVTLIAGVFDVQKPFFDRNAANIFTNVGDLSHQGVEMSLSGRVAPGLTVVAGVMLLKARIEANAAVASFIGPVPIGRPNRNVRLNVQYAPASWKGFSIDGQVNQDGPAYATRTNTIKLDANTTVDLGARYSFKMFDTSASARLRVMNVTDAWGWTVNSAGSYNATTSRRFTAQLVADF